jgi:hypothetical protein
MTIHASINISATEILILCVPVVNSSSERSSTRKEEQKL